MTEKQKKEKKSMNGGFLSVNRLYYSNKQFCSIFKILLFSNGHESVSYTHLTLPTNREV